MTTQGSSKIAVVAAIAGNLIIAIIKFIAAAITNLAAGRSYVLSCSGPLRKSRSGNLGYKPLGYPMGHIGKSPGIWDTMIKNIKRDLCVSY
jgi:hypothetical protein